MFDGGARRDHTPSIVDFWVQHVSEWVTKADLVVGHEDVVKEPATVVASVADLLGLKLPLSVRSVTFAPNRLEQRLPLRVGRAAIKLRARIRGVELSSVALHARQRPSVSDVALAEAEVAALICADSWVEPSLGGGSTENSSKAT
jgi:hypothetical protein